MLTPVPNKLSGANRQKSNKDRIQNQKTGMRMRLTKNQSQKHMQQRGHNHSDCADNKEWIQVFHLSVSDRFSRHEITCSIVRAKPEIVNNVRTSKFEKLG